MKKKIIILLTIIFTLLMTGCKKQEEDTDSFTIRNIPINMKLGIEYDYNTICYNDETKETTGTAKVTNFKTFKKSNKRLAKEGYEWQQVEINIIFKDENFIDYGYRYGYLFTDYYNPTLLSDTLEYDKEKDIQIFTVKYDDKEYKNCKAIFTKEKSEMQLDDDKNSYKEVKLTWEFLVPEGYDGIVVGLKKAGITPENAKYFYEYYNVNQFLLFRLK